MLLPITLDTISLDQTNTIMQPVDFLMEGQPCIFWSVELIAEEGQMRIQFLG